VICAACSPADSIRAKRLSVRSASYDASAPRFAKPQITSSWSLRSSTTAVMVSPFIWLPVGRTTEITGGSVSPRTLEDLALTHLMPDMLHSKQVGRPQRAGYGLGVRVLLLPLCLLLVRCGGHRSVLEAGVSSWHEQPHRVSSEEAARSASTAFAEWRREVRRARSARRSNGSTTWRRASCDDDSLHWRRRSDPLFPFLHA
jgi:hypothetical protein